MGAPGLCWVGIVACPLFTPLSMKIMQRKQKQTLGILKTQEVDWANGWGWTVEPDCWAWSPGSSTYQLDDLGQIAYPLCALVCSSLKWDGSSYLLNWVVIEIP